MLPQMMPLPWLMVFFLIFFFFFSVSLILNFFFVSSEFVCKEKMVEKFFVKMPW
uniref:ATP synthase F0 subunit 8 n=1 Tax=Trouessartia rubecula TaxID=474308 RepID=A0A410HYF1_9ACAR|nr:ATP synthase F0 subunit 8 [Trouessartia rubecula]QAB47266.1 ATP synthase F0 subunit 8 [Trouessartia rubecula]